MVSKRTPINRETRRVITPRAVALFQELQAAGDEGERQAIHSQIHEELQCKPWDPCVANPQEENPYWRGTVAADLWPAATQLWAELERMAAAQAEKPPKPKRRS